MIILSYEKLGSEQFKRAVQKLGTQDLPNRIRSKFHYIVKGVNAGLRQLSADYKTDIEAKFAVTDENGKVQMGADGDFMPKPGVEKERLEAEKVFKAKTFEIDREPMTQHDLEQASLSAFDLEVLGPVYVEIDNTGVSQIKKVK